jgi:hypothetical protein
MTTKVEQALVDANAIIAQFVPLVSIVGIGVRATIALLKANNLQDEARKFEDELLVAETEREKLGAAIAEFRQKYPLT